MPVLVASTSTANLVGSTTKASGVRPKPNETNRPPEVAVVLVFNNTEQVKEDVKAGVDRFDLWLRDISGGTLTVERLQMVAGSLPILGNIMALIDVLNDILNITDNKLESSAIDYVILGVDLIGVVPAPGTAGLRMGLRPALHLVKQKMKTGIKNSIKDAKQVLPAAIVEIIMQIIGDKAAGELAPQIDKLKNVAVQCIQQGGDYVYLFFCHLVVGLNNLKNGYPFETGAKTKAIEQKGNSPDTLAEWVGLSKGNRITSTPKQVVNFFAALPSFYTKVTKAAFYKASSVVIKSNPELERMVDLAIIDLFNKGKTTKAEILKLQNANSLFMQVLNTFVEVAKGAAAGAAIKAHGSSKVSKTRSTKTYEATGTQNTKVKDDVNRRKQCYNGTCNNITFATGNEFLVHQDFSLQAAVPITFDRIYASKMGKCFRK